MSHFGWLPVPPGFGSASHIYPPCGSRSTRSNIFDPACLLSYIPPFLSWIPPTPASLMSCIISVPHKTASILSCSPLVPKRSCHTAFYCKRFYSYGNQKLLRLDVFVSFWYRISWIRYRWRFRSFIIQEQLWSLTSLLSTGTVLSNVAGPDLDLLVGSGFDKLSRKPGTE